MLWREAPLFVYDDPRCLRFGEKKSRAPAASLTDMTETGFISLLNQELGADRADILIDYFSAALSIHYKSVSGTAGMDSEGYFRNEATVSSNIGPYGGSFTWVLRRRPDGALVSVIATGDGENWEDSARRFFIEVLNDALAGSLASFVHRRTFMYIGPNLAGEYWFGRLRVAPLMPNDDRPNAVELERALVIEQEVRAPDRVKAHLLGDAHARRAGARAAFLLDAPLRAERRPLERWITVREADKQARFVRAPSGVVTTHFLPSLPTKGQSCPMGRYAADTSIWDRVGPLAFPHYARKLWRAVESNLVARTQFDAMCQLYQVGVVIEEAYPTAALAYFVSAAESAAESAAGEGSSFGAFMRRFAPVEPKRDALINRLYGDVRSGHFHAGQFVLGDFGARGTTILGDPRDRLRGDFYFEGRKLLRRALLRWAESLAVHENAA